RFPAALAVGNKLQPVAGRGFDQEMEDMPGAVAVDAVAHAVRGAAAIANHHAFGMDRAARETEIEMFEPFSFQRTPARNGGEKGAKHDRKLRSACRRRQRYRPCGWRSPTHCRTTTGCAPWCLP